MLQIKTISNTKRFIGLCIKYFTLANITTIVAEITVINRMLNIVGSSFETKTFSKDHYGKNVTFFFDSNCVLVQF